MRKIEVAVLDAHSNPGGMMMFLAKLTQRGHNIHTMSDLLELFNSCMREGGVPKTAVERVAMLPHGTIKRFAPIMIAVVGASRRFLAQARTNQVGFNYVSASLQYSDYSGQADFVVPYALLEKDKAFFDQYGTTEHMYSEMYLDQCAKAMDTYAQLAEATDNDTAGYVAPQGLRNILIMQANHQAWDYWIRLRGCNRNTEETQYITMRIWEELLKTPNGKEMFRMAGPDCMYGACREGRMCCGTPIRQYTTDCDGDACSTVPSAVISAKWPLLK